jgi:hypothetical protein
VPGLVHDLEVEEEEVGLGRQAVEGAVLRQPGRIDGRVETAGPAGLEKGLGEPGLDERVAAGQRDAAARLLVEDAVPLDLRQHVLDADLGAAAAQVALGPVDGHDAGGVGGDGPGRAGLDAGVAAGTARGPVHELGAGRDAFGIVAPEAMQAAALEEDGRPDARSVMDRVAFDVENAARHHLTTYDYDI